jgi:hypothetical protein
VRSAQLGTILHRQWGNKTIGAWPWDVCPEEIPPLEISVFSTIDADLHKFCSLINQFTHFVG